MRLGIGILTLCGLLLVCIEAHAQDETTLKANQILVLKNVSGQNDTRYVRVSCSQTGLEHLVSVPTQGTAIAIRCPGMTPCTPPTEKNKVHKIPVPSLGGAQFCWSDWQPYILPVHALEDEVSVLERLL